MLAASARLEGAGVWDLIYFALLDWLARSDQLDWSRAVVDSRLSVRCSAVTRPGQIPPIGPSAGASVISSATGGRANPVRLTGANRNDSQEALASWMRFLRYRVDAGDPAAAGMCSRR